MFLVVQDKLRAANYSPLMVSAYSVFEHLFHELEMAESRQADGQNSECKAFDKKINAETRLAHYSRPLTITKLEMFEAELRNQGLLKRERKFVLSLSQLAERDISLWRWRALRLGMKSKKLEFSISLPYYLLHKANQILVQYSQIDKTARQSPIPQIGQSNNIDPEQRSLIDSPERDLLISQLHYFTQIAEFLTNDVSGNLANTSSRPHPRELELLVRAIASGELRREHKKLRSVGPDNFNSQPTILQVVLPTPMSELIKAIRKEFPV